MQLVTYRVVMEIGRADAEDLAELRQLLATKGWDDEFDPARGTLFVARDQATVGCLQVVDVDHDTAVLDIMFVQEERRREGIGTALMDAAMTDRPRNLYLSCREDAVSFYETLGFHLLPGGPEEAPESVKTYWRTAGNRAPLAMFKKLDSA